MRLDVINEENCTADSYNNADSVWHRPTFSRIDIKRTLGGVSGTSDGYSPTP